MRWLFKYYWGLLLVALPAILGTAIPFLMLYLGTHELAISTWNASPLNVIFVRSLFAFVPTIVVTLLITICAFLVRRYYMRDKKNSTLACFGKALLFFTLFIVLTITTFLVIEYVDHGYIV